MKIISILLFFTFAFISNLSFVSLSNAEDLTKRTAEEQKYLNRLKKMKPYIVEKYGTDGFSFFELNEIDWQYAMKEYCLKQSNLGIIVYADCLDANYKEKQEYLNDIAKLLQE